MDKSLEEFCENVAHASNILEAAVNEMRWACEHFGWNDGVCEQIDAAIRDFGMSIALSVRFNPDENDPMDVVYGVEDGLVKLSKALATLVRWFDDEADVSEV